ncbi:hypothetical protein B0H13DRAFT_2320409 [Mycena leptocephala]|nr:hypothetical protein B0H13DRAFT_2320409 [Mycena leptocephala]
MSNAPYDAIAHSHRFEPPNWLDPRRPLTQRPISPHASARRRAVGVDRISVPTMRQMRASLSVPIAVSLRRRAAASLTLLTNDLVFEHPSRTRSMLTRICIASQPSCAGVSFRSARRSFLPPGSVVYDMHRDYQHFPPPAPAFCSSMARNVMHSSHSPPPQCTPRLRSHQTRGASSPTPYHVRPQHQTPAHARYDTQQALPFLDPHAALIDPAGVATILSGVTTFSALGVRLHAPLLGCVTPLPCAAPVASNPQRIRRFPRLPLTTTICGAAPFSRSLNYHLYHHSQSLFLIAGVAFFFHPALRPLMCRPPPPPASIDTGAPPHARRPACAHWEPDARHHRYAQRSTPSLPIEGAIPPAAGPPPRSCTRSTTSSTSSPRPFLAARAAFFASAAKNHPHRSTHPHGTIGKPSTCDSQSPSCVPLRRAPPPVPVAPAAAAPHRRPPLIASPPTQPSTV